MSQFLNANSIFNDPMSGDGVKDHLPKGGFQTTTLSDFAESPSECTFVFRYNVIHYNTHSHFILYNYAIRVYQFDFWYFF